MKVIVIGAGIGGLGAAVAQQSGIDRDVHGERSSGRRGDFRGLANGVKCMAHLGMGDKETFGGPLAPDGGVS